ncbi:MAG: ABC transporter permease [Myxococcales bacterium]|nr:ABC transporter permease [Myxococcales bacterium]
MLLLIAARSLWQHKLRSSLLGAAIASVTALLLVLTGISVAMRETILRAATTLMTGHVNVGGFFKVTAGQSAPVVTSYGKVMELAKREVPELDYAVVRGRGWAKLISDTGSMMVGVGGVDIDEEPGFREAVMVPEGRLDELRRPGTILIFREQAKKLGVKVGDTLTVSAPTFRGVNNTVDVTVVAIAADLGLLSSFNTFMPSDTLRALYQLKEDSTGVIQLYLRDREAVPKVESRLREVLARGGFQVMGADPRPFWEKFESVNREAWTGQRLDVTNWEDETAFVKFSVTLVTALSVAVTVVLLIIICVGIMNVMWISIRERTREIGTLRAIGMQRRTVLAMFVGEGALLGLAGTGFGAALGLLAAAAIDAARIPVPLGVQFFLMTDHLTVSPTPFWVAFAVCFITGAITLVSLFPSFLAARMKPITAIHHVG